MHFKAKPKLGNVSCAATVMCQYWAGIGPIVAASAQYAPSAGTYIYMFAAVICVSGIVIHRGYNGRGSYHSKHVSWENAQLCNLSSL